MRKLGSLVLVAFFALSLSAGVASASPNASDPPSTSGGDQGKGATTDKYRASYIHAIGGNWDCVGVRVVNRNQTKDSFECTVSNLVTLPARTYTESNTSWRWRSDYDGKISTSFSLVVSDNGDGTGSVQGVAYYS